MCFPIYIRPVQNECPAENIDRAGRTPHLLLFVRPACPGKRKIPCTEKKNTGPERVAVLHAQFRTGIFLSDIYFRIFLSAVQLPTSRTFRPHSHGIRPAYPHCRTWNREAWNFHLPGTPSSRLRPSPRTEQAPTGSDNTSSRL